VQAIAAAPVTPTSLILPLTPDAGEHVAASTPEALKTYPTGNPESRDRLKLDERRSFAL